MKDIKIIFFDIDGTLVDMKLKKITDTMLETLHSLQSKGIKICIATGRPPYNVPKFDVDFDIYMTFNGSLCMSKKEVLVSNPIPKHAVNKIVDNANKMNRPIAIASASRIGCNAFEQDLHDYFEIAHQHIHVIDDFDDLKEENIYQMMSGGNDEVYAQLLEGVSEAKAVAWWHKACDIIPSCGGKGIAVNKVLEYYGYTKDQAMAFGDGSNDIDMLKAVTYGIAMGNATENVKKIAYEICDTVANEGITTYLKQNNIL